MEQPLQIVSFLRLNTRHRNIKYQKIQTLWILNTHISNFDHYLLYSVIVLQLHYEFVSFADMGRSMIALFIISFLAVFSAFCTGVTGCWRRSPGNITATAILMLLACKCLQFTQTSAAQYFLILNQEGILLIRLP